VNEERNDNNNLSGILNDFGAILRRDESYPIGLGANVVLTNDQTANWDIQLRTPISTHQAGGTSSDPPTIISLRDDYPGGSTPFLMDTSTVTVSEEAERCAQRKIKTVITLNPLPLLETSDISIKQRSLMALYGTLRSTVARTIQATIRPVASLHIAVLLVWTGTAKQPPAAELLNVARAFVKSDPTKVTCLLIIEGAHLDLFRAAMMVNTSVETTQLDRKIRIIHDYGEESKGNLTHYIHAQAETLVPSIKGRHHHYPIGWSLCDFRWLFGAIFEPFLSKSGFTHWAWGDLHTYPGKMFGAISDYGYDFLRHDVVSFNSIIIERDRRPRRNRRAQAPSRMAFSSGAFTAIKNTLKGRELFRLTPREELELALIGPGNELLDEIGTSNAVFGAANVSIALIGSRARIPGTVMDHESGRMFYIASDFNESADLQDLVTAGRVNEPFSVAPMGPIKLKARSKGRQVDLPGQTMYNNSQDADVEWYHAPSVNPDHFRDLINDANNQDQPLLSIGTGFSTLLRDLEGRWWNRPVPNEVVYRGRNRRFGSFADQRPIVRVEIAMVHTRHGGPCLVRTASDVFLFDWTLSPRTGQFSTTNSVDLTSRPCRHFKHFFSLPRK